MCLESVVVCLAAIYPSLITVLTHMFGGSFCLFFCLLGCYCCLGFLVSLVNCFGFLFWFCLVVFFSWISLNFKLIFLHIFYLKLHRSALSDIMLLSFSSETSVITL